MLHAAVVAALNTDNKRVARSDEEVKTFFVLWPQEAESSIFKKTCGHTIMSKHLQFNVGRLHHGNFKFVNFLQWILFLIMMDMSMNGRLM